MISHYKIVSSLGDSSFKTPIKSADQRPRSRTFSALSSPEKSPEAPPYSTLYRNRGIEVLLGHLKYHADIDESVIGKVGEAMCVIKSQNGFETGVLISKNQVLTCLHGISYQTNSQTSLITSSDINITFTYPQASDTLKINKITPYFGDLVILELAESLDERETIPIIEPKTYDSHTLIHLHHANDGKLRGSVTDSRQLNVFDFLERGNSLLNECVSWGPANQRTRGIVTTILKNKETSTLVVTSDQSSQCRTHEIEISQKEKWVRKHYEDSKIEHDDITLSILRPPLFGENHAIVGHKSGDGGSGGIYITMNGELVGIHIGFVKELLVDDKNAHFRNRYCQYPWIKDHPHCLTRGSNTFYDVHIEKQVKTHFMVKETSQDVVKDYLSLEQVALSKVINKLWFQPKYGSNIFNTKEQTKKGKTIRMDNEASSEENGWFNLQMQIGSSQGSTVSTVYIHSHLQKFIESEKENKGIIDTLNTQFTTAVKTSFKLTKDAEKNKKTASLEYPISYLYLQNKKITMSHIKPDLPKDSSTVKKGPKEKHKKKKKN